MSNDALAQYLDALSRQNRYRVDTSLKVSDYERTEIVFLNDDNGAEIGPFIRKIIKRDTGLGQAYERIFEQQQKGYKSKFIPFVHECYADEANLVIVMDYIAGETLQDLIYRLDPSPQLTVQLFPQICDAVSELHTAFNPPLIHRDLKPSNIMVSGGQVSIIDFGIAREFKNQASADTMHFGTRAYAPPEQFGYGQTTTRSDVYALGMLLYFCLVEETPTSQVVENKFADARIPVPLQQVLVRATAFDPNNRFASAIELKQAFEAAVSGIAHVQVTVPAQINMQFNVPVTPPAYTEQIPTTKPQSKLRVTVGVIWNALVALAVFFLLCASVYCIFVIPVAMTKYPVWVDVIGYAVIVPAFILFIGFLLLDKSRLKRRFPRTVGAWTWHNYLATGVIIVVVTIAFLTLAAMAVAFGQ